MGREDKKTESRAVENEAVSAAVTQLAGMLAEAERFTFFATQAVQDLAELQQMFDEEPDVNRPLENKKR